MKLKHVPKLDPEFLPLSMLFKEAEKGVSKEVIVALERNRGLV